MSDLTSTGPPSHARPRLRLVQGTAERCAALEEQFESAPVSADVAVEGAAHVLVVGADESGRKKMLGELRGLLPAGTPFVEACETWEALGLAPASRMVVLTGDLGDISADSFVRVLSRRYPALPVVAVGGWTRLAPRGDVGAALV
jgi:hypothetical protein